MRIVGYGFDGAFYCIDCATKKRSELNDRCECDRDERDENGLCQENCHGYGPNPAFSTDDLGDTVCDECGVVVGEL